MKTIITVVALLIVSQLIAPNASAQGGSYQGYITAAEQQIDQYKLEIERIKLSQAQFRASRNERAAAAQEPNIRRYQNMMALKQQEISMYQQQENLEKQPRSTNPGVAGVQDEIRQLTFEKAQFGIRQTTATQVGNAAEAARVGQMISAKQLQITAKQQEIKLLEMQAKTGR